MIEICPFCNTKLEQIAQERFETSGWIYDCANCGPYELTFEANTNLPLLQKTPDKLPVLSHAIHIMNERSLQPVLKWELIERIAATTTLPSPPEQISNLLLLLGDHSSFFGQSLHLDLKIMIAAVGAANIDNLAAILRELINQDYFDGQLAFGKQADGKLTLHGWLEYEQRRNEAGSSRKAFMAMPYENPALDTVFSDCFRPAVLATGFDLRRLDDEPAAGLIDDRLRVQIRTSRFLIADLTGGNQGAYWEAGYAEGLGRPVIYTCEIGFFKQHKTHFDANHHLTVTWDEDNLPQAAEALKVTVRATLPGEAILEDRKE